MDDTENHRTALLNYQIQFDSEIGSILTLERYENNKKIVRKHETCLNTSEIWKKSKNIQKFRA